jgi:hypothetical protein
MAPASSGKRFVVEGQCAQPAYHHWRPNCPLKRPHVSQKCDFLREFLKPDVPKHLCTHIIAAINQNQAKLVIREPTCPVVIYRKPAAYKQAAKRRRIALRGMSLLRAEVDQQLLEQDEKLFVANLRICEETGKRGTRLTPPPSIAVSTYRSDHTAAC